MIPLKTLLLSVAVLAPLQGGGFLGVAMDAEEPVVTGVIEGSPAARSDIQVGDRFLAVGGEKVEAATAFIAAVSRLGAGDRVRFDLRRGDKEFTLFVVLGERPEELGEAETESSEGAGREQEAAPRRARREAAAESARAARSVRAEVAAVLEEQRALIQQLQREHKVVIERLEAEGTQRRAAARKAAAAAKATPTEPRDRPFLGLGLDDDATVVELVEGGPGALAGLDVGDRILRLGRSPVRSTDEIVDVLTGLRAGQTVRVRVRRDGGEVTLPMTLGAAPRTGAAAPQEPRRRGGRAEQAAAPTKAVRRSRAAAEPGVEQGGEAQLRRELDKLRAEVGALRGLIEKLKRGR